MNNNKNASYRYSFTYKADKHNSKTLHKRIFMLKDTED